MYLKFLIFVCNLKWCVHFANRVLTQTKLSAFDPSKISQECLAFLNTISLSPPRIFSWLSALPAERIRVLPLSQLQRIYTEVTARLVWSAFSAGKKNKTWDLLWIRPSSTLAYFTILLLSVLSSTAWPLCILLHMYAQFFLNQLLKESRIIWFIPKYSFQFNSLWYCNNNLLWQRSFNSLVT